MFDSPEEAFGYLNNYLSHLPEYTDSFFSGHQEKTADSMLLSMCARLKGLVGNDLFDAEKLETLITTVWDKNNTVHQRMNAIYERFGILPPLSLEVRVPDRAKIAA